jgi:hypothetical protein
VAAVDAAGNVGPPVAASVAVPSLPPATPTGLIALVPTGTVSVRLAWTPSARATGYRVLRDGALLATTVLPEAVDTAPIPGRQHAYTVVALDVQGLASAGSAAVVVVVPLLPVDGTDGDVPGIDDEDEPGADVRPPGTPTGLTLKGAGRLRLRLSWSAARDDVGVAYYRVERGGRLLRRTTARTVLLARRALSAQTALTVRAVDAAGNVGRPARLVVRKSVLTAGRNVR